MSDKRRIDDVEVLVHDEGSPDRVASPASKPHLRTSAPISKGERASRSRVARSASGVPLLKKKDRESVFQRGAGQGFALTPAQSTALTTQRSTDLAQQDILTRYIAEIKRHPLLTQAEEEELTAEYYETESKEAAQTLVLSNLRLVVKIAMEYRREWSNVMDLIQEGNLGLAQAVRRFDPDRGVRFGTFARYWIRALILQYILKNHRMVSFANTRAGRKIFFRLEKERAKLMAELGEAPIKLLAHNLDVSEDELKAVMQVNRPTLSLNAPRKADDPDGGELIDALRDDELDDVELNAVKQDLNALFRAQLTAFTETLKSERDHFIWSERVLNDEPTSLATLGEQLNVSRERVRQIEKRLKLSFQEHLKRELGEEVLLDFTDEVGP